MKNSHMISVDNLHKSFMLHSLGGKKIEACRDISFKVEKGSFLGLAGPSGVGKSTILKCLYRTYIPSKGVITYNSELYGKVDLAHLDDQKIIRLRHQEIGYISQFLKVIPRVSALNLVMEPILVRNGLSEESARQRAVELLNRLRIPKKLFDAFPVTFSGGEQQRINIARAIGWKPRILLLDEPTASLDSHSIEVVAGLLADLRTQGTTMIGIFHDQSLLHTVADHVYYMS